MTRFAYFILRRTWVFNRWLQRRFTPPGLMVLSAAGFAAVLGVDTDRSMSFQMFTLLLAALLASVPFALFYRPRFAISRELPQFATAGSRVSYRIVVRNQSTVTQRGVVLRDNLADPRPTYRQFKAAVDAEWRFFRRPTLFDIWRKQLASNGGTAFDEKELPALPAGHTAELTPELAPQRRGVLRFDKLTVARPDPLNIMRGYADYRAPAKLLVLPKCYRLPPLALSGARRFQQGGVALASSVGDSEEFVSLRDYRPGDPLQRVHWKSFARVGYPVIKEYHDEFFERHALVLDTFAGGASADAFEEAVAVAASFAATVDTQECLLDLIFVGQETFCFTAGRGQMQAQQLLEVLAVVTPHPTGDFALLASSVKANCAALSSVILVLLSWDEARRELVAALQATGLRVLALLVADKPDAVAERKPWLVVLQPGEIQQGLAGLKD